MIDETLIFRADANEKIGSGHVMRSLALAQAWRNAGGHAVFVMDEVARDLEVRLIEEGVEVRSLGVPPGSSDDAEHLASLSHWLDAKWIVADGYYFGSAYQEIVKGKGLKLLLLDDFGHADQYFADIVLNQNIYADESFYENRERYTTLLLGTGYALLRKEFLIYERRKRQIPDLARKIIVTFGGADPENVTEQVAKALNRVKLSHLEVKIVIGPVNPHRQSIEREWHSSTRHFEFLHAVNDMAPIIAWGDIAIIGGGSTCWEMAFMGTPILAVILAENQQGIVEGLARAGAALNCGWFYELNEESLSALLVQIVGDKKTREELVKRGQWLVDGLGAQRVLRHMMAR